MKWEETGKTKKLEKKQINRKKQEERGRNKKKQEETVRNSKKQKETGRKRKKYAAWCQKCAAWSFQTMELAKECIMKEII